MLQILKPIKGIVKSVTAVNSEPGILRAELEVQGETLPVFVEGVETPKVGDSLDLPEAKIHVASSGNIYIYYRPNPVTLTEDPEDPLNPSVPTWKIPPIRRS